MPPVLPPRAASTPPSHTPVPQNPIPSQRVAARWRRGLACLLLFAAGSALGSAAPLGVSVELPDPVVRQIYSANR